MGSAVCIGEHNDRWWFLTVGHAYRRDSGSKLVGSFLGIRGKWLRTTYLRAKLKPDMALVSLKYDGSLVCVPIATTAPAVGSQVKLVGFPGGRHVEYKHGNVRDSSLMIVGAPVRGGYSGGGVYNSAGQLAGIIWGGNKDSTHATSSSVLTSFVREHLGVLPKCHRGRQKHPPKKPGNVPPPEEVPPAPPVEDLPPSPATSSLEGKLKRLEKKIDELQRDLANVRLKKGPKGDPGIPGPSRTVTVIFQDETGRQLTAPVVVPPDKSTVRVPIERIVRD